MITYKQLTLAEIFDDCKNKFDNDKYQFYPMLKALLTQRIFSIPTNPLLIIFLKYSQELRDFCGFDVVPDGSEFTRFKQDFLPDLQSMFDHLVDLTEPVCQKLDSILASMPTHVASNQAVRQMYINRHFCYAYKFRIIPNGPGIVRDISFYNKDFLQAHPDIVVGIKSDSPDEDKSLADSKVLLPVLIDFFQKHPLIQTDIAV